LTNLGWERFWLAIARGTLNAAARSDRPIGSPTERVDRRAFHRIP